MAKKTLKLLSSRDILHAQSLVCVQVESSENLEIPDIFICLTQRRYGSSYLTLLQRGSNTMIRQARGHLPWQF